MSEKLENKNKRRRGLPGPPLPCAAQQQQAGPARRRPSHLAPLLCRLPSRQGNGACPARARATAPRLLPPCLPVLPSPLWMDRTSPRSRPGPFPLPLAHPLLWLPLTPTERGRRRRREPPRPQPPPRPSVVPTSSATSSSTPSPNHAPPEALQRRLRALLQPSAAGDLVFDSRRLGRPQAH